MGIGKALKVALTLVLFCCSTARGQVVALQGGSSTLYEAAGGGVILYLPNSTNTFGAGFEHGHIALGASSLFEWHDNLVTVGDKPFSFSAGGAGLTVPVRGISVERKREKQKITVFLGAVGQSFSAPFIFQSTTAHNFGTGLEYERQIARALTFSSLEVAAGSKHTVLQALDYHTQRLTLAGSAGALDNARVLNAQARIQPISSLGFAAGHQTYVLGGRHIGLDSAGAYTQAGIFDFNASGFSSKSTGAHPTGESAGAGMRLFDRALSVRSNYFHSGYGSTLAHSVTERISWHWSFSQFVTQSAGKTSVSFGGGFNSNRLSVSIDQQFYFMPLYSNRSPFQKSLALTVSIRLPHSSAATVSTNIDPTGRMRYSVSGNSYFYPQGLNPQAGGRSVNGKYIVRGIVLDEKGERVEGAAVLVGKETVYTTPRGEFFLRVGKAKEMQVRVLTEEFLVGTWAVVDAPKVAQPGSSDVVRIVVRRAN